MRSIGIFTYSTKPRGSVVHAACLAEALQRKGAQVTLYALSKAGDGFFRPLSCMLQLILAEPAPSQVDALIRQRIAEFCVGIRALGVSHAICHAEDCLAANALIAARAELHGARLVRTVHHVEHFESPYLMDCQRRSVSGADLVLSVSQVTSREVQATFGREAPVISNGVDLRRFAARSALDEQHLAERLGIRADDLVVLSVGGVEPRKNSQVALKAVALAFAVDPRLRWIIAGGASIWEHDAYRQEFTRQLAALPVELRERITILGTVPEGELSALYQLSDVLLCPSLQEGFGLCVLEALAAKCAVIVPQGAPFDEYLDERCATFVNPGSPSEIAWALTRLLGDERERERSANDGHERVQRFSWDLVAERHLARYESVLGSDALAAPQALF
ncbi:MAG TPA: MSMEG_0565 family glycosyltransferase [Polyangiaceae bacterium]|nr:MSMEG_0565 family glycosyltransferase [Polyangiaceae bacterium]